MGNLGWTEIFFIVAFALIVFGPRRLPEIARTLGRTMAQLRRTSEEFRNAWEAEVEYEARREAEKKSLETTEKIENAQGFELKKAENTQPIGAADSSAIN